MKWQAVGAGGTGSEAGTQMKQVSWKLLKLSHRNMRGCSFHSYCLKVSKVIKKKKKPLILFRSIDL